MLIGTDANEANLTPNLVGINEYAFNLLHALYELKTSHTFVIYLKTPPRSDLPPQRPNWHYRVIPFPGFWTQTRLPWDLYTHRPRPDVFFSMTHYAPRWSPVPTVVAIMDLGFLRSPEQFTAKDFNQLKSWTSYSIRQATRVIAISEYTKQEIIKTYNVSPAAITVTPLAYDQKLFKPTTDASVLLKYGISKPYILFLGSLKPNKNVEGLIRAFYSLEPKTYNLVIAGKKAWLYDSIIKLAKDRVVFTGFVDSRDKPALMSQAAAFIMPSFFEGFGIPVLEAMACGTSVVISDVASLPEVGGDATIYVDPHDPKSIAQGIIDATGPERGRWVKKGLERVKLFSWATCAQLTLKCLETATAKS
ncbi:MAG: Glycosyl transferase, group 1 [Candidatus Amesbacteria bacterium GW2011_GWA2_47_11b]|uniref:Glycosyl transferase, group 1 n=3 Tax=Candidatus Amesiibacteriota TaxID=1752730 RepID=A0A0G1SI45_9BACT|nr:MAG: group 1 glycosyl transferase [Microgenomates group bacterium GW2011_GWC1_46_20]KKU58536.1 MAG: Glycosyl transferase, group 1 [Candidatus Amesbacteria bacterium GW2011_GWA2_47_11b]KKU69097.1 MAG: Glycosyl transferase, group 1 [Candidatus Amesbacteria bacterium GW2011_GWA1_47_20]KKU83664.1 MAG: Glycosyl transferase, group 1 [Candidatus Amesbacteria bacterium GW2011_GWC2_47_8]